MVTNPTSFFKKNYFNRAKPLPTKYIIILMTSEVQGKKGRKVQDGLGKKGDHDVENI